MSFELLRQKAAVGSFRRSRNTISAAAKKAKRSRAKPRKRVDPVSYDGDNDGKITNPLTGADEIPWNRDTESPQEAIAKFFANRRGGATQGAKPTAAKPVATPNAPKDMPEWPRSDAGELVKVKDLDDATLSDMIDYWSDANSSLKSDAVKKLLGSMRRERTKRQTAADKRRQSAKDRKESYQQRFPDSWRGPRSESIHFDGASAEDRFRSEYISADIIDASNTYGEDAEGFDIVGEYRSDWDERYYFEQMPLFNTIEDAMQYLEDLEAKLYDGDDPNDPDFVEPVVNSVTGGESVVDSAPTPNVEGSVILNDAYDLFTQKWLDRRFNDNIEDNIREADWRMDELRQMMESLQEMYAGFYPDFESAYYMSANEYANWAVRSGYAENLTEGRQIHREIMEAWDEMYEEQEIITDMIDVIRSDKEQFVNQWNDRHNAGNPLFPSSYQ